MQRMPKPLRVLFAVITVSTTFGFAARAGSADAPANGVSASKKPSTAAESDVSSVGRSSARALQGNNPPRSSEVFSDVAADKSVRLREGTELKDRLAVFKPAGDRTLCFVSGMPQRMIVLENLALERVLQTLERSSVELQWSIRGVVSEYRGANYLLIQRAVVLGPTGVPRPE